MSRAFIKDSDDSFDDLPERPISSAPNWVTEGGLAAIEAEIAQLSSEMRNTREDRYALAKLSRDLRYWTARRGSAHVVTPPVNTETVQFGSKVTIDRADGRREVFRIVGEDEADPTQGTISHVSPLARAILGRSEGDSVRVNGAGVEIAAIC